MSITYDIYMAMKQVTLADMVLSMMDSGHGKLDKAPSAVRKMKKADLAALLYEWDNRAEAARLATDDARLEEQDIAAVYPLIDESQSGNYNVQRSQLTKEDVRPLTMQDFKAFKAARNLKKALCCCGQWRDQLENGTMSRHTRHNIGATAAEIRLGVEPERIKCLWSGKFPPAIVDMRKYVNRCDAEQHVGVGGTLDSATYTYSRVQTPDTRGPKTFQDSGSRRGRRVGTKNKHRAAFGLRFAGVA